MNLQTAQRSQKEWVALLDEVAALAVKARDEFSCRAKDCKHQWLPVMMPSGRVVISVNCHWAHIIPRARGLLLRHELENGLTLCFKHHKEFDALNAKARIDFLLDCGVTADLYEGMSRNENGVIYDFNGKDKGGELLVALNRHLRQCEEREVVMELDRKKVVAFYAERLADV